MIRVLIADDHPLMIEGIRSCLEDVEDIEIAGEAGNGYQVLEMLEAGTPIDVILMDINMPKLDGLECTRQVVKRFPGVKVIALSQYDEKRFVKRMVKNGAKGYLLKDAGRDQIGQAVKKVNYLKNA